MAKRRNTTSRKNTQSSNSQADAQDDNLTQQKARSDYQDQSREQKERGRPRSSTNSSKNGASLSYASLFAVALVIGSALFYSQLQGSSAIAPLRQPRAPHFARRSQFEYKVGDDCTSVCDVCLSDSEFGRCEKGKIVREGTAPTGMECQKSPYVGCGGVAFGKATKA
ncbi:hypothetical protein BJ742DRAFT_799364 [Cladochytrium replicatum]|nr:hypothetical protein BJ742DRAFT_799364 [Cladochytrium replicatum]